MQQYKVRSPVSMAWADGPMQGMTPFVEHAHPYREDDLHLHEMVKMAKDQGMKLRLRSVPVGVVNA